MLTSKLANSIPINPDFKHDPLPHPITHIRLLEIQPQYGREDHEVRCRTKIARLADFDKCYVALSYAWAHDDPEVPLVFNNKTVKVKANVYRFLRIYRQKLALGETPAVFLWVDALCLDYTNVQERNCQAQIMPNIFQRSKAVLSWLQIPQTHALGKGKADLVSFTRFLQQACNDLTLNQNYSNDKVLTRRYVSTAYGNQEHWCFLANLCSNSYWSRLWVLQETRFAETLLFMYDETIWTWEYFRAPFVLAWYLTESRLCDSAAGHVAEPLRILNSTAGQVIRLRLQFGSVESSYLAAKTASYSSCVTERWHSSHVREPLTLLLERYARWQCTDPRDKIYALIGLSDSSVTIDYSRTNIELFCTALLTLRFSLELKVLSMLAHQLDVSAFKYYQNRRTLIMNAPSTMQEQSAAAMVGRPCDTVISVKLIPNRIEITDLLQSRLGVQKIKLYRIVSRQSIGQMKNWNDIPDPKSNLPRIDGHTPGTNMPIVDGFDLSQTSFRAAMFFNPFVQNRKALLGMLSTADVQEGDIFVAEEKMHSGLIIRISGLVKTWLTVVGVVLFARRVTVEGDFLTPLASTSPTSTIRSASLSDFCEHTQPTVFTISDCDEKEHFRLKPNNVQLQRSLSSVTGSDGRTSRASTLTATSTFTKITSLHSDNRRFTSKSDKMERFKIALNPLKRRNTTKSDSSLFRRDTSLS